MLHQNGFAAFDQLGPLIKHLARQSIFKWVILATTPFHLFPGYVPDSLTFNRVKSSLLKPEGFFKEFHHLPVCM